MSESQFYNEVGLLEEAQRYKTSYRFLELLHDELNGSKRLLLDGLGARLLTITSALTDELHGVDINQGSIDRAEEFIASWIRYQNQEPFKREFEVLKERGLTTKFVIDSQSYCVA